MEKFIPEVEAKKGELELAEKIGDAVADGAAAGYQAIEHGVVAGYKTIENAAVSGFTKVSDGFVGAFLTREGESVEDAKARLSDEQHRRETKNNHSGRNLYE